MKFYTNSITLDTILNNNFLININTFDKSINTLGLNILVFENDCTQNFIIIDFSVDKLQQILSDNER